MNKWKAQVSLSTGVGTDSFNMQWVEEVANNAFEARLAIEAKYGKILQGPIMVDAHFDRAADRWY